MYRWYTLFLRLMYFGTCRVVALAKELEHVARSGLTLLAPFALEVHGSQVAQSLRRPFLCCHLV